MAPVVLKQRPVEATAWVVVLGIIMVSRVGGAESLSRHVCGEVSAGEETGEEGFMVRLVNFLWQRGKYIYHHVWPEMEFGWRLVLGSIIGFFGAAVGSVGGVGGGGIFVPTLTLIIGFDPKSSTAISKYFWRDYDISAASIFTVSLFFFFLILIFILAGMIMGAAGSTVYYNLRHRHPTLELPIIDYDLALLFQPMLMLGISIGVAFNVMFADWMVTVLLIILFLGTSTKALFKGIETWKKETIMKKEAAKLLESESKPTDGPGLEYKPFPSGPNPLLDDEVPLIDNIYWKEFTLLVLVWVAFLAVQIVKTYAKTYSLEYWLLNLIQEFSTWGGLLALESLWSHIDASVFRYQLLPLSLYEAICLYRGKRVIASKGKELTNWKVPLLFLYCFCGIVAGIVGGLLGLGGGFILGPLFLELEVPPQVASATSTFVMVFSSSMSVVQYYLLKRFPVPYASYFVLVATIAAFTGQHVVRKLITLLGRASIIIFILAMTIFVSALSLGGVGIANMLEMLEHNEYMGFESLCQ